MKEVLTAALLIAVSSPALAAPANDSYRPEQPVVSLQSTAPRASVPELGRDRGRRTANPDWDSTATGMAGDVVLVSGGMAGTMSEIAYAWMYDRPIIAMSCCEGWSKRMAGQKVDDRRDDAIIDCKTIAELEAALKAQLQGRKA